MKRKDLLKLTKEELIEKYEDMMYSFEEYDVWEDEILPTLESLSEIEIVDMLEEDYEYYSSRETRAMA